MSERPILFSAPMVSAILAGKKTQTRRVVKLPARHAWGADYAGQVVYDHPKADPRGFAVDELRCPYGRPGDHLWVRETFYCDHCFYPEGTPDSCQWREVYGMRVPIPLEEKRADMLEAMYYRADGEPEFEAPEGRTPWRPSIHMPRWASRTNLAITGVRVERLQDISEADAIAEGVEPIGDTGHGAGPNRFSVRVDRDWLNAPTAAGAYRMLWEQINSTGNWAANPWVWVVAFKAG